MSFQQRNPDIQDLSQLNVYLKDLERRIAEAFQTGDFTKINLAPLYVAPDKPRYGDVINAAYDAGAGTGFYGYNGSNYDKLG